MRATPWLAPAVVALAAWSAQRLLSKVALVSLGTRKFYLLSGVVSLAVNVPYLVARPPAARELLPAAGLACLMAVTFGVTTEAIRRGPLGAVSPITSMSPALTAVLAVVVLGERVGWSQYAGIVVAPAGIVLLGLRGSRADEGERWLGLALVSLVLQGVGAFLAKVVVSPAGPSALLLAAPAVQCVVGLALAPPRRWSRTDLHGRAARLTILAYGIGGAATIGYLLALSRGPASLIVPLVATSPAVGGLLGIFVLREKATAPQWAGIALAITGAVLLARKA